MRKPHKTVLCVKNCVYGESEVRPLLSVASLKLPTGQNVHLTFHFRGSSSISQYETRTQLIANIEVNGDWSQWATTFSHGLTPVRKSKTTNVGDQKTKKQQQFIQVEEGKILLLAKILLTKASSSEDMR